MPLLVSSATGANGDGLGAVLGFDGEERFLGEFSNDSCTADPRGLAVNRSATVTIRGAEAQENGGRLSAKLHEFSGALEQCRQRSAAVGWLQAGSPNALGASNLGSLTRTWRNCAARPRTNARDFSV
jgi:hypothetical protein